MNILQITSSARPGASHSSKLAAEVVARLQAAEPGATLTSRDLGRQTPPALDEAALQALFTPAADRSAEQAARVAHDDALIAEAQAADVLVLAVPMYNFGVPGSFKNWIDAIARAGVTFKYTDKGPVGLLQNKKVYLVTTRGGIYRDQPADSLTPYLKSVLGFLGLTDVSFVFAEGLNLGPDAEAKGLAQARQEIEALFVENAALAA
jgi:FMN-dependent NADH-azoreductase